VQNIHPTGRNEMTTQHIHGLTAPAWHPVVNCQEPFEEIPPHAVMEVKGIAGKGHGKDEADEVIYEVIKPNTPASTAAASLCPIYMVNSARPIRAQTRATWGDLHSHQFRGMGTFAATPTIVLTDPNLWTTAANSPETCGPLGGEWFLSEGQLGFKRTTMLSVASSTANTHKNSYGTIVNGKTEQLFVQDVSSAGRCYWGTADNSFIGVDSNQSVSITIGPRGSDTGLNVSALSPFHNVLVGKTVFIERYWTTHPAGTSASANPGYFWFVTHADTSGIAQESTEQLASGSGAPDANLDAGDFEAHGIRKGIIYHRTSGGHLYVCTSDTAGSATWVRLALFDDLHDE